MAMTVEQAMTQEVESLTPEMTLKEMDRVLLEAGISGAPVLDGGRLVGIASRGDVIRILYREQKQAQRVKDSLDSPFPISLPSLEHLAQDSRKIADHMIKTKVSEVMSVDPVSVNPHVTVDYAARLMTVEGIHRLPVVENGELVGILSTLDIVALVGRLGLAD